MNNETTISSTPSPGTSLGARAYFLVIRAETSSLFPLPPTGQILVGRAPEADLRIVPDAGHSAFEPGNIHELVSATDRFAED